MMMINTFPGPLAPASFGGLSSVTRCHGVNSLGDRTPRFPMAFDAVESVDCLTSMGCLPRS